MPNQCLFFIVLNYVVIVEISKNLKLSDCIYKCECGNVVDRDYRELYIKGYADMVLFEFKDISFSYAGSSIKVLENINLSVNEGDFVLVTGNSGSGKTTLLRHMKKCITPTGELSGEIIYKGKPFYSLSAELEAEQIGYVGQNPDNQIVTDKVWHELAFGLENLGLSSQEIRRRSAETAAYFGIDSWYRADTAVLSGGQKQLLNLASIMIMHPKLIVLDEPTAQLSPIAAQQFIDTLVKLNREQGITIVITEHRTERMFEAADRVIILDSGKIVCDDIPQKAVASIPDIRGVPSAARIYLSVNGKKDNCPITVREGRSWLKHFLSDNALENHFKETDAISSEAGKRTGERPMEEIVKKAAQISGLRFSPFKNKNDDKAVVAKNITFRYESNGENILENLSFSVDKGELYAVLGGNGAGKTTLLKLICGINKCVNGKLKTDGRVVLLSQNPMSMFTEISVEEELAQVMTDKSNRWAAQLTRDEKLKEIEKLISKMELENVRRNNPYDLSGGQQQKLAIAKALLLKPEILLLDEPTKGIDVYFKAELGKWFKELNHYENITIIMVSHDMEFCAEFADTCAMLFDKTIISQEDTMTFFLNNSYYTTAASKITADIIPDCITCEQAVDKITSSFIAGNERL